MNPLPSPRRSASHSDAHPQPLGLTRRPAPRTGKTKRDNWFRSAQSPGATSGAGVMCFIGALVRPGTEFGQNLFTGYGLATAFAATPRRGIFVILITLVTALIISGAISLFKRVSKNTLPPIYAIRVLFFVGLGLAGNLATRSIVSERIEIENKRQLPGHTCAPNDRRRGYPASARGSSWWIRIFGMPHSRTLTMFHGRFSISGHPLR